MFRTVIAAALSLGMLSFAAPDASAQGRKVSEKAVGVWTLSGHINQQGAPYCVAARQVGEVLVLFARFEQGYGLALQSPNWWLTKGASVRVRVVAASMGDNTVEGQALSTNLILARLTTDPAVMRRMAGLPEIKVTAENETVSVPLDGFSDALTELDTCLAKRGQMGAPTAEPAAPPAPPTAPAGAPATPTQRLPMPNEDERRALPASPPAAGARLPAAL